MFLYLAPNVVVMVFPEFMGGFFFLEASDDFGFESGQFALIERENVLAVGRSAVVEIGETNKPTARCPPSVRSRKITQSATEDAESPFLLLTLLQFPYGTLRLKICRLSREHYHAHDYAERHRANSTD